MSKINQTVKVVADHFDLTVKQVRSSVRTDQIALARQMICLCLMQDYKVRSVEVAQAVNKGQNTVYTSMKVAKDRVSVDKKVKAQYEAIKQKLEVAL